MFFAHFLLSVAGSHSGWYSHQFCLKMWVGYAVEGFIYLAWKSNTNVCLWQCAYRICILSLPLVLWPSCSRWLMSMPVLPMSSLCWIWCKCLKVVGWVEVSRYLNVYLQIVSLWQVSNFSQSQCENLQQGSQRGLTARAHCFTLNVSF